MALPYKPLSSVSFVISDIIQSDALPHHVVLTLVMHNAGPKYFEFGHSNVFYYT
jgi:hypothetical protein